MSSENFMMSLAIIIIMFGIGLQLHFKDFKRVFIRPKAILTGLFCQLILLPLIAIAMAFFWPISDSFKLGLILIAACPGGTASNLLTHLLKGKVALSVSLTAFNSFIIVLSIPLWMRWGFEIFQDQIQELELNFKDIFNEVFLSVIIPVVIGLLCRKYFPVWSKKAIRPMNFIMPSILLVVFAIALFSKDQEGINQIEMMMQNLPLMLLLLLFNLITILAGFYFSAALRLAHSTKYTIGIEMGLQNSALAIFIANQSLNSPQMSIVAVFYGSFTFFTTLALAYILKKRSG